jgi:hypothetical protein
LIGNLLRIVLRVAAFGVFIALVYSLIEVLFGYLPDIGTIGGCPGWILHLWGLDTGLHYFILIITIGFASKYAIRYLSESL